MNEYGLRKRAEVRTGQKDALGATPPSRHRSDYAGPEPVITAPAPNTPSPAFGKKDGVGEFVRSIAAAGPRVDQPAGVNPRHAVGATIDKTLRHLDRRRVGGLPPREKTYVGPIASPQVPVPEAERRR
jgi:hypothetical protein